jgi:hypothetical protein
MSPVWVIPVFVVAVGGLGIVALLRVTIDSARELGSEVARFGELHVALARLRTEAQDSGRRVRDLRDR